MKLSGAVEQACCIMAILADPQRKAPMTNDALAEKMAVSPTYLKKISRKLVVAVDYLDAGRWRRFHFGAGNGPSDVARCGAGD